MPEGMRGLVADLGPHAQRVVESFGIPDHLLAAPIAGDCECAFSFDVSRCITQSRTPLCCRELRHDPMPPDFGWTCRTQRKKSESSLYSPTAAQY